VRGELVAILGGSVMQAGRQELDWRGRDREGRSVPSGSYFARVLVDGQPVGATARMSLVR
jgi:flagellar hook assembly protein FlgD